MKVIVISDKATDTEPGQAMLIDSLIRHEWDNVILNPQWEGYGTKLKALANYLRESDLEEFIMLDAFDTYAFAGREDFRLDTNRVIVGGRMTCQPHEWKSNYFIHASPWRFVDSGVVYGNVKYFLKMYDETPFPEYEDDAIWWTMQAIKGRVDVDVKCVAFQNIGDSHKDIVFSPGKRRVLNSAFMTHPVFVHGNGGANMKKVYDL